jgi:hypothetical protein
VKKSFVAAVLVVFGGLSAIAQGAAAAGVTATEGKMLIAANGSRVGSVYRVTSDGSAQLIVDGKLVTIPAATLSVVDGKLTTSLSKDEIRKLK